MKSFFLAALVALCFLVGCPLSACAQDGGMDWSGIIGTYAQEDAVLEAARGSAAAGKAATATRQLTYVPTPALRQQTVQQLARQLGASNAAAGQAVAATYGPGKNDYSQLYRTMLRESGFQDNDAASALAAYLEVGYRIVQGIEDDKVITVAQDKALRNQAARLLGRSPALRTPAAVARLGEELKLLTVVTMVEWTQARQSGQLPAFQTAIANQFKTQYHLDMRQFTITSQGLRKK